MTEVDREALKDVCSDPKSRDAVDHAFKIALKQSGAEVKAPVALGKQLSVPKLLIKQGDLFEEL